MTISCSSVPICSLLRNFGTGDLVLCNRDCTGDDLSVCLRYNDNCWQVSVLVEARIA